MGISSYLLNGKKYQNLSRILFLAYSNIEPFTRYVRMSLENKVQYPVPVLCQTFNHLFTKFLSTFLYYPNKTIAEILRTPSAALLESNHISKNNQSLLLFFNGQTPSQLPSYPLCGQPLRRCYLDTFNTSSPPSLIAVLFVYSIYYIEENGVCR